MNITFLNKLRVAQIPRPLFKYFRLVKLTSTGTPTIDYQGIKDWKLYTGINKTGTVYPTTSLTCILKMYVEL